MSKPKKYYDSRAATNELAVHLLETGEKPSLKQLADKYEISDFAAHQLSARIKGRAAVLDSEVTSPIGQWDAQQGKFIIYITSDVQPGAGWNSEMGAFTNPDGSLIPGWDGGE